MVVRKQMVVDGRWHLESILKSQLSDLFMESFPQKSSVISGSFAEHDLQLKAFPKVSSLVILWSQAQGSKNT